MLVCMFSLFILVKKKIKKVKRKKNSSKYTTSKIKNKSKTDRIQDQVY